MRLTLFAGNMTYRVELTDRAVRYLAVLYEDKHVEESKAAARWFNGLEQAVDTLGDLPRRCTPAPESEKAGKEAAAPALWQETARLPRHLRD